MKWFSQLNAVLLLATAASPCLSAKSSGSFNLSIIHINDLHAKFDETSFQSTSCKKRNNAPCVAGVARVYQTIMDLKTNFSKNTPIYLNAGDNYQGSFWYTHFKWQVVQAMLELYPPDVMTLGNHEFDDRVDGLEPFMKNLSFPVVIANMDSSNEPSLHGTYNSSIVLIRRDRKIGVIGLVPEDMGKITAAGRIGNLSFSSCTEAAKAEAEKLHKMGVMLIIVLSHCGLDVDRKIAQHAADHIDVIVGGHSHSLLYNGNAPTSDAKADRYPIVVKSGRRKILIVQANCYGKYVGHLNVQFNSAGEVTGWSGAPIFQSANRKRNKKVLASLKPWKEEIKKVAGAPLGKTMINLDNECRTGEECKVGSFLLDGFVDNFTTADMRPIAIANGGNFRNAILQGDITLADLYEVTPFEGTINLYEIPGYLLEDIVKKYCKQMFWQVSGLRIIKDKAFNVTKVEVRTSNSMQGENNIFERISPNSKYNVVTSSYVSFTVPEFKEATLLKEGGLDINIEKTYIQKIKIVKLVSSGRIVVEK